MTMAEPVNKKSGYAFRIEKERKNKAHEEVMRQTAKLENVFITTKMTTESQHPEHEQCNIFLQSNHSESCTSSIQADANTSETVNVEVPTAGNGIN